MQNMEYVRQVINELDHESHSVQYARQFRTAFAETKDYNIDLQIVKH